MALTASSSSSFFSTTPKEKYDVFISFRGEDTRDNFTSHLYGALSRLKIDTFIDDHELRRGDSIPTSLLSAIERSMISVVIFSQDYASSRWCLEELVKVLQCRDMYRQTVIPVFYHVEPSHVRNQTGAFGDGLAKLAKRYKDSLSGTEAILGICLDMSKIEEIHLNHNAFTNMRNLRFLKLYKSSSYINKVHGFEAVESNFRELRFFFFDGYPAKSLPSNFNFKNLVQLHLPDSNMEQLWMGNQSLDNLKHLDLSGSRNLFKISDLSLAPNLEKLDLRFCERLQEISSSDLYLNKLVYLNLAYCRSFNSLPMISFSKSLTHIDLSGLFEIQELSPSICYLPRLVHLIIRGCSRLEYLPGNICGLKSLEYLSVDGCSNLKMVPELPRKIIKLDLPGTGIRELPASIEFLIELEVLNLGNCSKLESLPNGICKLKSLRSLCLWNCSRLEYLPSNICELKTLGDLHLNGCSNLKMVPELPCGIVTLNLRGTGIRELPSSIEFLIKLETLYLQNCSGLESLPNGICKLKSLGELHLSDCPQLDKLPEQLGNLEALELLDADETAIREVPFSILCLKKLRKLSFKRCKMPQPLPLDFQLLSSVQLQTLDLSDCCITELPYNLGQL